MGEQEAAGRGPGEWGTHNSAKRCCRLSAGRLLILVAAVDEAIFSIASFFLRKNGGKVPRPKVQKSMMWPGSERFQAWLPNQEDVAYDSGLGFGLLCSMFPLMAATGSKHQILETSQAYGK